jgi:hypothetical protein
MQYVRVFNGTTENIVGRYDGDDYEFMSGSSLDVPAAVAAHIFGLGVTDKNACLARLGWLTTSDQLKLAHDKLKLVKMEAIEMVGRVIEEEDSATSQQIAPDRIGAASPRVSSDGTQGVGGYSPAPADLLTDADTI